MAVELFMGYKSYYTTRMQQQEHSPVEEAASAGLQSVEKLLQLLSHSQQQQQQQQEQQAQQVHESELDCRSVADVAVNKFKKVISLLGRTRTGHARFRRAPPAVPLDDQNNAFETKEQVVSTSQIYIPTTPIPHLPPLPPNHQPYKHQPKNLARQDSSTTISFTSSTPPNNSFISSETPNGQIVGSLKRNCSSSDVTSGSGKRKKSLVKRVVKVPAISLKTGDIPPDDYSWRKYGQKPIKGSPHPRSYYKCCNLKDCPARKHVERSLEDPTMLIVTYEGEHSHAKPLTEAEARILESS